MKVAIGCLLQTLEMCYALLMNGRILPNGEIETWPDNENVENVLILADQSVAPLDPSKPLRVSHKVEPVMSFKRIKGVRA